MGHVARHARSDDRADRPRDRFGALTIGWIWLWGFVAVVTVGDVIGMWAGYVTVEDGAGAPEAALISGLMLVLGVFRLRWLVVRERLRDCLPPGDDNAPRRLTSIAPPWERIERHHRLPRPKSAAREPMRRLAAAEAALAELMRQLSHVAAPGSIEHAWRIAAAAAAELRALGSRLEAVEFAAEQAMPHERAELEDGIRRLRGYIERGLDAYRGLVAAGGRALAASPSSQAAAQLGEAAEQLAGLAQALRELSGDYDR
jgi:hypothetical protein